MDDATSTTDVTGDDWEAALIARAKGLKAADQESEEKEVDEEGRGRRRRRRRRRSSSRHARRFRA